MPMATGTRLLGSEDETFPFGLVGLPHGLFPATLAKMPINKIGSQVKHLQV